MPAEPSGAHWDSAYAARGVDGVSWFEAHPATSLELIAVLGVSAETAVLDAGGGGALLADELARRGFCDVTVLDVSAAALDAT